MKIRELRTVPALAGLLALAACGGSGDSLSVPPVEPEPTAVTTIGKVSGFGSVYVNGVRFETTGSEYEVDDQPGQGDADLAVGMVVKVTGSVNPDGVSGTATRIDYDDEIEGIVEGLAVDPADADRLTFTVMGVSVVALGGTRFEGEDDPSFGFDTIANGDNVEISGDFDGDVLVASYIEKQEAGDNEFEARGVVSQFNGTDQFTLTLRNGGLLRITVGAGAEIPTTGISDGQFVEVEGTIPDPVNAPDALLAGKVELEDEDRLEDGDDEVKLVGRLNRDAETAAWSISGVMLTFDPNTEYDPASLAERLDDGSAQGLTVKVEGRHSDGGVLVREIELEEGDLEFKAVVDSLTISDGHNGTITLSFGGATGTVEVVVDNHTMFLDDHALAPFDLDDIVAGNHVEVDALITDSGTIRATSLQREDGPEIEITGTVDAIDDLSITVQGITFTLDASTAFPDGVPTAGQLAEVEDENADGLADEVEPED